MVRAMARRPIPHVHCIAAGPAPENSTAEIRRIAPSHLIIIDAADMEAAPGTTRLIDPSEAGGASFATHGLPLGVLARYLCTEVGCGVLLIGIQPQRLEFGESLSRKVSRAVEELHDALRECLDPRTGNGP